MKAPTAINKRGTKVYLDGYTFDSQKEADFYQHFIKDCGFVYRVHPRFVLQPLMPIEGTAKMSQVAYTPDFVVFDEYKDMMHVYDVKNSFGAYGIDTGNRLRFKWFTAMFKIPVEAVVVRAHDFKTIAQGVTKPLNEKAPLIRRDVNYRWQEATAY
ncbi:MAG: DUF1064 domain-containing protein [Lactobacillus sp.]|jgi:hypothetical protein|nr:DUF1064 domain-containing protein [Lactobacillus sp.]MCI2032075.1 DUF1064 domain-containing protein [Lactobacillus sp.]